jgi:hypothetical protein
VHDFDFSYYFSYGPEPEEPTGTQAVMIEAGWFTELQAATALLEPSLSVGVSESLSDSPSPAV